MPDQIRLGDWDTLQDEATKIRFTVFVDEQKVPAEEELDDLDAVCRHALAYASGLAVATGRLAPDGRIGRMAVLASHRGQHYGAQIMHALLAEADTIGHAETYLHAQCHALGFYEKFGFVAEGPIFDEAGIDHRTMRRPRGARSSGQ
jgi:predicted GNAT family N-acyltransferase